MPHRYHVVLVSIMLGFTFSPIASGQIGQPDIIQEHWYHSYATLTLDVNEWANDNPDIVRLVIAGQTELGRNLFQISLCRGFNRYKCFRAQLAGAVVKW